MRKKEISLKLTVNKKGVVIKSSGLSKGDGLALLYHVIDYVSNETVNSLTEKEIVTVKVPVKVKRKV